MIEIENLKQMIKGNEITLYQRSLAIQEFNKLFEKAKKYDEIESKIDWKKIRNDYFNECTYRQFPINKNSVKINMAPHDLFEWFKSKVDSNCL
jgi:hypothetical protein